MDSDSKHRKSLFDLANRKYKINEVSPPNQLYQSAGGIVNTGGNDPDNISKDDVRGPDNSSPRVTSLHEKIKNDLSHFKSTLAWWHKKADDLDSEVNKMMKLATPDTLEDKLREVELEMSRLKSNLPAPDNLSKAQSSTPGLPKVVVDAKSNQMLEKLQAEFKKMSPNPTIQGVRQLYDRLDNKHKNCLLCLTAFPENAIIKKRVLINWWVGEEFLDVQGSKRSMAIEEAAEKIFKELGEKGFIMLVHKKGKQQSPVPDSCQLHPFTRWVLITLAKEANFLDFDSQGNPAPATMPRYSRCPRACLVEGGQLWRQSEVVGRRLQTLFNMNERFLNLRLGLLSKCKVLQLGRWVVSPDHNIDVDDAPSLLRGMGTMQSLRYLSLQGVTKIGILPASICKLSNLTILDLGACQSLETLPEEIGYLGELTYLDFSECYMISHMPKSLKNLLELRVLKGFVLYHSKSENHEEACTLSDLAGMQKLWKLSLRVDKEADLGDDKQKDLSRLPELTSLTITWIQAPEQPGSSDGGTDSKSKRRKNYSQKHKKPENNSKEGKPFPHGLMKLDLRGYPRTSMPEWVTPSKVDNLEKLYIRGGNLANLNWNSHSDNPRSVNGDSHSNNLWTVKILRLKFLANCEIEWLDLRDHFRSLVYMEKFQCPKLKFFPCDGYGVWMNPHAKEEE